jgi:hypothetical protein
MSVSGSPSGSTPRVREPLDVDLEWLFDDPDDPSEITVFTPRGERTATEWITVDAATAVSVDEIP